MLSFLVRRDPKSYSYLRDSTQPFAWDNNDSNNSLDIFEVWNEDIKIFSSNCQTVSNTEGIIDGCSYSDTIKPGTFQIKLFLPEQRDFWCEIHGIMDTYTQKGDYINFKSVTDTNDSRWLCHDWEKHRSSSKQGVDTRVAWSAGCFVLPDANLVALNTLLRNYNYKSGDVIKGLLEDIV